MPLGTCAICGGAQTSQGKAKPIYYPHDITDCVLYLSQKVRELEALLHERTSGHSE